MSLTVTLWNIKVQTGSCHTTLMFYTTYLWTHCNELDHLYFLQTQLIFLVLSLFVTAFIYCLACTTKLQMILTELQVAQTLHAATYEPLSRVFFNCGGKPEHPVKKKQQTNTQTQGEHADFTKEGLGSKYQTRYQDLLAVR